MAEYELFIEKIRPCGKDRDSQKSIVEIDIECPDEYVRQNNSFPVIEKTSNDNGDLCITAGDQRGNVVKYTFTE